MSLIHIFFHIYQRGTKAIHRGTARSGDKLAGQLEVNIIELVTRGGKSY